MSARARLVNVAWLASCRLEHRRFRHALADPAGSQRQLLQHYLRDNASTAWGREHRFERLRSRSDFARHHPLTTWDDYQPYVERIMGGESRVLTNEPVKLLEPSSGSTAACKLVPYTGGLQREFNRGIAAWVRQMFAAWPGLVNGPAYWSVSPVGNHDQGLASQVPVGFNDDSEYLGGVMGRLVAAVLAVPEAVRRIDNMDAFRYVTLLSLLRTADLRLISVWHPSYLQLLLEFLPRHWESLLTDLADGTICPPQSLAPGLQRRLCRSVRPSPRRAHELSRLDPCCPSAIWPRLQLISCWADGHAAQSATHLMTLFPDVPLQPKGLIATEAMVTLPFAGQAPLAIRSHYFEFLADDGQVLTADQLHHGQEYTVVVTTSGGLYRYCLGDRVRVAGFAGRTPSLRFLGKEDCVSDLCGEKLNEGFVAAALARAAGGSFLAFAMLAPDPQPGRTGYTLYVQEPAPRDLAADLENELHCNPHYRYCRDLSQLQPVRECRLEGNIYSRYVSRCAALGQGVGDVKPIALSPRTDWEHYLSHDETRLGKPCAYN
jgi:hypothetical protein